MALLVNQHGVVNVGLTKKCVQYKRAVGLLVATAFIDKGDLGESFDCPINLDGDRYNNRAMNLAWRPRWFATKYFQQIEEAHFNDRYPIEELKTRNRFESPWDAALKYGLLQVDILLSVCNGDPVWPTRQVFRRLIWSRRYQVVQKSWDIIEGIENLLAEADFQAKLIKKLREMFPGCLILKNDSGYLQGVPDLIILYNDRWAMLEVKASEHSRIRPNQPYYVERLNEMSFAAFIFPSNEQETLRALQQALEFGGNTRLPRG
jgi:hypothetical protein